MLKRKKLFNNKEELIDSMFNFINLKKENNKNPINRYKFFNEKILVNNSDYYFSNVIARASKTMSDLSIMKK